MSRIATDLLHFAMQLLSFAESAGIILTTTAICTIAIEWMRPVGAAIYAASAALVLIPRVGKFLRAIIHGLLNLSFLFKAVSLLVGSSGGLLLLVLTEQFAPSLLMMRPVIIGIAIAATLATLRIMDDVHLMNIPDFHGQLPTVRKLSWINLDDFDNLDMMRLARMHYVDGVINNLLIVIVCYGLTAFCFFRLGLVDIQSGADSPLHGVSGALYFARTFAVQPLKLTGIWGELINVFYGFSLLVFLSFFISLSSRLIDEKPTPKPSNPIIDEKELAEFLQRAIQDAEAEKSETIHPVSASDVASDIKEESGDISERNIITSEEEKGAGARSESAISTANSDHAQAPR